MQGVSINIFIKSTNNTKQLADVFHYDLQGKRDFKYSFLNKNSISSLKWEKLKYSSPNFFFMQHSMSADNEYNDFVKISELFSFNNTGIQTGKDSLVIDDDRNTLIERIKDVLYSEEEGLLRDKYHLKDTSGWNLAKFKKSVFAEDKIVKCDYRPFDTRYIFFDNNGLKRDRISLNKHILNKKNISLSLKRQSKFDFSYCLVHLNICESCLFESAYANNSEFPLYLYPEATAQQTIEGNTDRKPNLNLVIIGEISGHLGLNFTKEKETTGNTFAPIDILDYVYAVLHSPTYREKYKEFLKIDFSRVPYPKDKETFWRLVKLGGKQREIHLLENPIVEQYITQYPINGNNLVEKPVFKDGKVYINETQYVDNVPQVAWEFYIGGYQPAQKWLKDRQGRTLDFDDILHYQKIIVALSETDSLMKEIDKVVEF